MFVERGTVSLWVEPARVIVNHRSSLWWLHRSSSETTGTHSWGCLLPRQLFWYVSFTGIVLLPNYLRRGTVLAILITVMLVSHVLVSTSFHPLFSRPFPVSLHPQTFKTCIGTSLATSEIAFTHLHYTGFTNGGSEPALCTVFWVLFSPVPRIFWDHQN